MIGKIRGYVSSDKFSEESKLPIRVWLKAQDAIDVLNQIQKKHKSFDEQTSKAFIKDIDNIGIILQKYTR